MILPIAAVTAFIVVIAAVTVFPFDRSCSVTQVPFFVVFDAVATVALSISFLLFLML